MPAYVGDRIRQARVLRWRTSKDLAEELAWPAPKLTRMEQSEKAVLSDAEAARLCKFLAFPEIFFTEPAQPALAENELLFRAPKRTTKREKAYLAEFARIVSMYVEILDGKHRLPPVRLPALRSQDDSASLEGAASEVRAALEVDGESPIGYLTHQVERAGVVVVVRPNGLSPDDSDRFDDGGGNRRPETHYGYSTWVGNFRDRPVIVMRSSQSWERTRWTMAHELGHLLLHRQHLPSDAEREASRFASELLAPHKAVARDLVQPATLAGLVPLKQKWGISIGALLFHLRDNRIISEERFDALRTQLYTRINSETGRTWGYDEPGWQERAPEAPRLLSAWTERCFGTVDSRSVSLQVPQFPADVLSEMLREQRTGAPGRRSKSVLPAMHAQVHSLTDRRTKRETG